MRILIVDCHIEKPSWGATALRRELLGSPEVELMVRRAPERDLPRGPSGFGGVVVSGSLTSCLEEGPWIDDLLGLIRGCLDQKVPLLGVCFGHQMLARALSGKSVLGASLKPEYGWTEIERTGGSPIFEGLPQKFYSFSSHREEVTGLPLGTRALARSRDCGIQAFDVEGLPAFGIQFHPEKLAPEGEEILGRKLKKDRRAVVLRKGQGARLYSAQVAASVFGGFTRLVGSPR